jgi:hypothetical protein
LTTVFDIEAQREIRARLDRLTKDTPAVWGAMRVAQMLRHVTRTLQTPTGVLVPPPLPWPVRFVGRLMKRRALGDRPIPRNAPTSPVFKVTEPCDLDTEKAAFTAAFDQLARGPAAVRAAEHVLFGPMTPQDWGRLMYKHIDHHFRQFGV